MCKIMEDMVTEAKNEALVQIAYDMIAKGKYTLEEVAEITKFSMKDLQELEEQVKEENAKK